MSLEDIKPSVIAIIEKTLQEKAKVLREQVNQFYRELRDIEEAIKNLHNGKGGTSIETNIDDTTKAIIQAHQDLGGKWLKPIQVRQQYKLNTGKEMDQSALRNYHRKYKGTIFEMRGKGRNAEWRLIKQDKQEQVNVD
jgi:hypothetical protein